MMRAWMAALAALLIAAPAAAQGQYPDKPVRFIVGFTAGSATDITARMFAQKFQDAWSVPVTVENVPGAGGSVGGDRVAKAAPDGTTFYWGANGALTINPTLLTSQTYDVVRDLAPVARLLVMPSILAVNNDVPAKSFAEFIALAKAQPGKLSYASPGVGTPQHIAGEMLKEPGRHRHRPCALSRRGVHRRDRRPRDDDFAEHGRDPAGGAPGPVARARRHLAEAHADHAGAADHRGIRPAGLRGDLLVRADGAGRHAGADHQQGLSAGRQDRDSIPK